MSSAVLSPRPPVPVLVLTGFLGAGKTTLMNRILEATDAQVAVVENELGDDNVDEDLLDAGRGAVFGLSGGCMCCQGHEAFQALCEDLGAREEAPELLLVETTGAADPGPLVQRLTSPRPPWSRFALRAVVVVVDAAAFREQLAGAPEVRQQIAFADAFVLHKVDRVEAAEREALRGLLASMRPEVPIWSAVRGDVPVQELLSMDSYRPERLMAGAQAAPRFTPVGGSVPSGLMPPGGSAPPHQVSVRAVTVSTSAPLDLGRLDAWLGQLARRSLDGTREVYRLKGWVELVDHPRPVVVHLVYDQVQIALADEEAERPPGSRLVVIGPDPDVEALQAGLSSCAVDDRGMG